MHFLYKSFHNSFIPFRLRKKQKKEGGGHMLQNNLLHKSSSFDNFSPVYV